MARNDLTGSLVADRYRLERKLGSGGMADVWLAEDQELGRRVAVKILHERYANDEQFVERFRREATHAAGLSHPNIVSIYDRGVADGSYYIVMEYIEGRTLKELIVTRGPLPRAGRDLVHATDPRGAALRAQERDHPQGHQAPQRDRRPRGSRQGRRLRHRAGRRERDDGGRLDRRNGPIPLPGAGPRSPCRRELRSLLDGDRPVRAVDRHGAVHGRDTGRDRDEAPLADARGPVGTQGGDPARPRPRRASRPREGTERPVSLGRRARSRSRARGAWRSRRSGDRDRRDDGAGGRRCDRRDRRDTCHSPAHACCGGNVRR